MNTKSHGPKLAVNISEKLNNKINQYGKNLLLNIINRGLAIRHYKKKGRFYRADSCTVFNSIHSSTVTSTK